jgi:hypothetical protein
VIAAAHKVIITRAVTGSGHTPTIREAYTRQLIADVPGFEHAG